MPPIKPDFPNPNVQDLKANLDKLGNVIEESKMADGKVDVATVERKLEQRGDETMQRGFGSITDAYQRTEMRDVQVGCSGTERRRVKVDPTELRADEVQSVMQAIVAAKAKVDAIDTNHDGKISKSEKDNAGRPSGLVEELAEGAIYGSLASYRIELRQWNEELSEVQSSVNKRESFDNRLGRAAEEHAETRGGQDAILWAYRELTTRGPGPDIWTVEDRLHDAETSWLRFIPFFGKKLAGGKGHLNDNEVKAHLRTDDLAAFVADKKAAITARIGGEYEAVYLKGTDLPGASQLDDPDFQPVSIGC